VSAAPEVVFEFHDQMPTGVTVADDGRIFVCYPRWGDKVDFTVAELRDGREVPFPDAEVNVFDASRPQECLVSVQSVVVDPAGKLWLLDTGSIELQPRIEGGAKLVCVDLERNAIERTIVVPPDVALETTYLNDIRFDLRRGYAFITDSTAGEGPARSSSSPSTAASATARSTGTRAPRWPRATCRSSRASPCPSSGWRRTASPWATTASACSSARSRAAASSAPPSRR
jgi:sugar lactone lactonase YvrE